MRVMSDPYSQSDAPILCLQLVYRDAHCRSIPIIDSNGDPARFEIELGKGDLGFALELVEKLELALSNPYDANGFAGWRGIF
jgi:hypothetical protein